MNIDVIIPNKSNKFLSLENFDFILLTKNSNIKFFNENIAEIGRKHPSFPESTVNFKPFREFYFTGSHDASIYAVLNKEADVGAAKNTIYDILKASNPKIDKELVILKESIKVPSNGLCIKNSFDNSITKKLKESLLNMHKDPEGKTVLKKFKAIKFIDTGEEDYSAVFDIIKKAGIDLANFDYTNK